MSGPLAVQIPAGKLGTVRVDRTVDVYPTPLSNVETPCHAKLYIPTLASQRQLPLIIENFVEERSYTPRTRCNHSNDDNEEDVSDIAVIYSVVRRASTRRTSCPRLSVLPLSTNFNIPPAQIAKSYTLEPPLIPLVTHISKQAQIKTLTSTRPNTISIPTPSQLTPPIRIQTSSSFNSHDRQQSVPLINIKTRPYSFRNAGRSVLERRISNITERVSQLQETFFSRRSNPPNKQRNRSLSTFHPKDTNINEYNSIDIQLGRPRPRSENFDDRAGIVEKENTDPRYSSYPPPPHPHSAVISFSTTIIVSMLMDVQRENFSHSSIYVIYLFFIVKKIFFIFV
jgi:hypothetical protein